MLDRLLALVTEAGTAILRHYRDPALIVERKDDDSPLTQADLEANAILLAGLSALGPIPVLSEERLVGAETRASWRQCWLVDPLDGTRDFLRGSGGFTVNVALIEDHVPILGVVHVPAQKITYWARRGGGAFRDGTPICNRSRRTGAELIAAESNCHPDEASRALLRRLGIDQVRPLGSALKLCKLAEGEVDLYPRLAPTYEWDIAAAQVVAEEGGCAVLNLSTGSPLRYNKADLLNPPFLALRHDLLEQSGFKDLFNPSIPKN